MALLETFLANYQIDYNLISKMDFNNWSLKAECICGILLYILLSPIYLNLSKCAARRFHELYPEEKILYIIKTSPRVIFLITWIIGGFFGGCLLPFFIFKNLYYIKPVHIDTWGFYFVWFILAIISILIRFSMIYILSDKNIRFINPFKIFDCCFTKNKCIPYADIKTAKFSQFLFLESVDLTLKDGSTFNGLIAFIGLKKAEIIINNHINKEVDNES